MKHFISKKSFLFFFLIALCFAISCSQQSSGEQIVHTTKLTDLSEVETVMPEAEGVQTFNNNCQMCHSPRYILNQPDFPEETWKAIVTKMQKTFGAPVTDAAAEEIVQYLVTIKGKS